jgi:long-subunit acyl-CoA synthetase (AMP-forming)
VAQETQEFLCITLCQIIQGYGMTESCGVIAVQPVREKSVYGIVEATFPSSEIKLVATIQTHLILLSFHRVKSGCGVLTSCRDTTINLD